MCKIEHLPASGKSYQYWTFSSSILFIGVLVPYLVYCLLHGCILTLIFYNTDIMWILWWVYQQKVFAGPLQKVAQSLAVFLLYQRLNYHPLWFSQLTFLSFITRYDFHNYHSCQTIATTQGQSSTHWARAWLTLRRDWVKVWQ